MDISEGEAANNSGSSINKTPPNERGDNKHKNRTAPFNQTIENNSPSSGNSCFDLHFLSIGFNHTQ
jgi:hypothetical protein